MLRTIKPLEKNLKNCFMKLSWALKAQTRNQRGKWNHININ